MSRTTDISLADARALITRAVDKAAHMGVRGAFAVVGGSGVLVSASRMDHGGAGGLARARSKAWISATQQIPSTEHHKRMATLPPPIAAGFVSCSPEANFPGAGGMPICDDDDPEAPVTGGFSASGATIGPFVDIPGIDRRMLIADGRPANSEDLIVLWALGLPYVGQHGDDANRWRDAFGELPDEPGLGYADPPPADQPERTWALELADRAMALAHERGLRVAVAITDHRGDPIQLDHMDGALGASPDVAQALAATAATFGMPSASLIEHYSGAGVLERLAAALPYAILPVPGGRPISDSDTVIAGLGIAGPAPALCDQIAAAVVAEL